VPQPSTATSTAGETRPPSHPGGWPIRLEGVPEPLPAEERGVGQAKGERYPDRSPAARRRAAATAGRSAFSVPSCRRGPILPRVLHPVGWSRSAIAGMTGLTSVVAMPIPLSQMGLLSRDLSGRTSRMSGRLSIPAFGTRLRRLPATGADAWDVWGRGRQPGHAEPADRPGGRGGGGRRAEGERIGVSLPLGLPDPVLAEGVQGPPSSRWPAAWDDWVDGGSTCRLVAVGRAAGTSGRPTAVRRVAGPAGPTTSSRSGSSLGGARHRRRGRARRPASLAPVWPTERPAPPMTRSRGCPSGPMTCPPRCGPRASRSGRRHPLRADRVDGQVPDPGRDRADELAGGMQDVTGYASAGSRAARTWRASCGTPAVAGWLHNPAVEVDSCRPVRRVPARAAHHRARMAIGELFSFASLAAACQRERRYEFCSCVPLT